MEVGQVSFKDQRKVCPQPEGVGVGRAKTVQVKRILIPQRENPIVNRLNKTKVEKKPDFKQEKDDRQKELRRRDQAAQLQRVCFPYMLRCKFRTLT